jgi:rhamnosyltransferase
MKITAVIVSFNPDCEVLFNNIKSYSGHVDEVLLIDNSTKLEIKNQIQEYCGKYQFIYHSMNGNKGIASALNVGFDYAIRNSTEWVLTMDQDSSFFSDLEGFKSFIKDQNCSDLMSLVPVYDFNNSGKINRNDTSNLIIAPQSGNLVSLSNYVKIGPFREDYFIDFVDYEYCLRAKSKGLVLHQINTVILNHQAGVNKIVSFFGIKYNYFEAAPFRYYYVVRNGLKTALTYKDFRSLFIVLKTTMRIVFIEKNKLKKIKFVIKGILDLFKPAISKGGSIITNKI